MSKVVNVAREIIPYLLAALFLYTAASKIMTLESFERMLGRSPLLGNYSVFMAWFVPIVEIGISVVLFIPKLRLAGLVSSLVLMLMFTSYLIYMVFFSGTDLPCSCGGVISQLSWRQHIWFNAAFIVLAVTGLTLHKKHKEFTRVKQVRQ
jgi:hypothetical protein